MNAGRFRAGCVLVVLAAVSLPGCLFHRHRNAEVAGPVNPGDQPDKILYEKAMNEVRHGRYDVGRLTLQTLINTYPDSEYLAKAKLAIADSYYNEGGMSGLTQSEAEYKDFITFFPTAPEAPECQYKIGMAHFRLMAKADRDRTEAKLAELEFKEFLLKYPDSPVMPRAKGRLREVQEILAQGDYKIAKYYYGRQANEAARSRFQEIVDRYPDFSHADSALWYVAESLNRLKKPQEAIPYYSRILAEHPLSPLVEPAKEQLLALHQPIPRPTRATLARAEADAASHSGSGLFGKLGAMMSGGPDTSATRHGPVALGPTKKPSGVEVAKTQGSPPGVAAPGATVVAHPVNDATLSTGKSLDPKSAAPGEAGNSNKNSDRKEASVPDKKDESAAKPPEANKKGRSIFKKLIWPF